MINERHKKKRLQRKLELFKVLNKLSLKDQQSIIDSLSGETCNILCEGIKNVCIKNHHNIKNRKILQKNLQPCKDIIKKLLRAKSKSSKRSKLKQLGKGFPLIIASLIPLITEVIKNL